jgi:hypothetical protein
MAPLSARMAAVISELATKACVPCRGGVPPLKCQELAALEKQVDGWNVIEEHHLAKTFTFPDFREALKFVNRVGEPPGPLPCLGKSRDHDLDAQDQRLDGKRFHSGRKNRPAPQILNSGLCVNPPLATGRCLFFRGCPIDPANL